MIHSKRWKRYKRKRLVNHKNFYFRVFSHVCYQNSLRFNMYRVAGRLIRRFKKCFFLNKAIRLETKKHVFRFYSKFHGLRQKKFEQKRGWEVFNPPYRWKSYKNYWKHWDSGVVILPKFDYLLKRWGSYERAVYSLFSGALRRFRSFHFNKGILRKFFFKYYQLKVNYLHTVKKIKIKSVLNSIKNLESRLDVILVRFGYFKDIFICRAVISYGFVFVNFKRRYNSDYLVKKSDVLLINFKRLKVNKLRVIWRFIFFKFLKGPWTLLKNKLSKYSFFNDIFTKKQVKYLKKYLALLKLNIEKPIIGARLLNFNFLNCFSSLKFFLNIVVIDTLRLSLFRRKLNLLILNSKVLDLLSHTKI